MDNTTSHRQGTLVPQSHPKAQWSRGTARPLEAFLDLDAPVTSTWNPYGATYLFEEPGHFNVLSSDILSWLLFIRGAKKKPGPFGAQPGNRPVGRLPSF